jgi:hypothetical protein
VVNQKPDGFLAKPVFAKKKSHASMFLSISSWHSNQSTETEHGVEGCENLKILATCKI